MEACDDDFPFAVYSFTSDCKMIQPITLAKDVERKNYGFKSNGGTNTSGALLTVVNDIKTGTLQAGKSPRILLLCDGDFDSRDYNYIVNECIRNGISISTVGFGSADKGLLQRLAGDTCGAFVWAENISQLSNAMNTAATSFFRHTRDLLSHRPFTENDTHYAVLRCLFLLLIVAGFIVMNLFMFSTFDEKNIALIIFIVCAICGGLSVELFANAFDYYAPGFARTVLCLSFGLLLGTSKPANTQSFDYSSGSKGFGGNTGSMSNGFGNNGFGGNSFGSANDKWKF
jgi:hypothetical protein